MTAGWLAALALAALTRPAPQLPAEYDSAITAYQAGNHDSALQLVSTISAEDLQRISRMFLTIVRRGGRLEAAEAAAMIHTELFIAPRAAAAAGAGEHFGTAMRLAHAICDAYGPRCEFLRQWSLLIASHFQRQLEFDPARAYLASAEARFRDDAEILLARGSLHEMMAKRGIDYAPVPGRPEKRERMNAEAERRRAAGYFRRSLQARPETVEARLRLGRVLHDLGDLRAAERELESAARAASTPALKYLGLVCLAAVYEDLSKKGEAASMYAEAARLRPRGQVVFLGMAELYVANGQPDEGAKAADRMFAVSAPDEPWWEYLQGESWHLEPRLERLRERVRR